MNELFLKAWCEWGIYKAWSHLSSDEVKKMVQKGTQDESNTCSFTEAALPLVTLHWNILKESVQTVARFCST